MVSANTVKCVKCISGFDMSSSAVETRLVLVEEDLRGTLFRLDDIKDHLTGLQLYIYFSKTDKDFQRIGNIHQLRCLYMRAPEVVSQKFISETTLYTIYDMLLDKEDWLDEQNTLQPLKRYLYSLFCFFFRYRNDGNLIGDPVASSVTFPTRLLSSSGQYIYLSGVVKGGALEDTRLVDPCMYDVLPSLEIQLPELNVDFEKISLSVPYKIEHFKQRLNRAGTKKDMSEFMMQLRASLDLVRELKKTSPFVVLPGYSIKLNEINILVPYFETLKTGLKPIAYIPLRRSEDGIYRPQTIYSLDIVKRTVRLFGYTHISGGVLI